MKVCLGGTFYPLHKGHKVLLKKALQVAGPKGSVFIGITSTAMAKKKGEFASFEKRKQIIEQFLSEQRVLKQAIIQPLSDEFGPTLLRDFDAIVVSPETKPTAEEINRKRSLLGKKPLQVIVVPFVLSEDRKPINSSRIRQKEIDENGILLKHE
ncbi:MAG TPA: pantetheine-phosphate adenylyltransferase [Candidatus Thermoplasmatota archaeon]|nr:pantetheine-phosphate adenylyltransferase [Candidatus Thermoplasmatota archaeon]